MEPPRAQPQPRLKPAERIAQFVATLKPPYDDDDDSAIKAFISSLDDADDRIWALDAMHRAYPSWTLWSFLAAYSTSSPSAAGTEREWQAFRIFRDSALQWWSLLKAHSDCTCSIHPVEASHASAFLHTLEARALRHAQHPDDAQGFQAAMALYNKLPSLGSDRAKAIDLATRLLRMSDSLPDLMDRLRDAMLCQSTAPAVGGSQLRRSFPN